MASRVQFTYEIDGDRKELPFVLGVVSDLSGSRSREAPLPRLKDRRFVEVDRGNFDDFLRQQAPRATLKVANKLVDDPDSMLGVDIAFESMRDFEPEGIVRNVKALQQLQELRTLLKKLQARARNSDDIRSALKKWKERTGGEQPPQEA